jgi:hypothetical protein
MGAISLAKFGWLAHHTTGFLFFPLRSMVQAAFVKIVRFLQPNIHHAP